jgi:hypothetical protein
MVSLPTRSIDAGTSNAGTSVRVAVTTTGASLTAGSPAALCASTDAGSASPPSATRAQVLPRPFMMDSRRRVGSS